MLNKLYSRNQAVLEETVQEIKNRNIDKFKTQNSLYCLIEDIKWPECKRMRSYSNSKTQPAYAPDKNYKPILNHLIAKGILSKFQHPGNWNSRIEYTINKEALNNF